jgi:hypothetical protein
MAIHVNTVSTPLRGGKRSRLRCARSSISGSGGWPLSLTLSLISSRIVSGSRFKGSRSARRAPRLSPGVVRCSSSSASAQSSTFLWSSTQDVSAPTLASVMTTGDEKREPVKARLGRRAVTGGLVAPRHHGEDDREDAPAEAHRGATEAEPEREPDARAQHPTHQVCKAAKGKRQDEGEQPGVLDVARDCDPISIIGSPKIAAIAATCSLRGRRFKPRSPGSGTKANTPNRSISGYRPRLHHPLRTRPCSQPVLSEHREMGYARLEPATSSCSATSVRSSARDCGSAGRARRHYHAGRRAGVSDDLRQTPAWDEKQ